MDHKTQLQPLAELIATDLTMAIHSGMEPGELMAILGAIMEGALQNMEPETRHRQWKLYVEHMNRELKAMP